MKNLVIKSIGSRPEVQDAPVNSILDDLIRDPGEYREIRHQVINHKNMGNINLLLEYKAEARNKIDSTVPYLGVHFEDSLVLAE